MINALFRWLESRCDPFPPDLPEKPPTTLSGFVIHYARPFWPLVLASSTMATAIALTEVFLFSFMGRLVDWLALTGPENLWAEHRIFLVAMGLLVLVGLPVLKFFYTSVTYQGLLGNFAMRTRWQAHRYLLRQSMEFFHNDFAGRVATKMMQTALAVRDTVLEMTDIFLYVIVYFCGTLVLFAASDIRLAAPMIVWLACYLLVMWYFVPRLRQVSMEQADRRSEVTGRVVDSYSNIGTVKMFSHAAQEDSYAREGMGAFLDNVYRQMRLAALLVSILALMNGILLFGVAALSIWLWTQGEISAGAIAFTIGLVLRMQGMSEWVLNEVGNLFENIGVVQDGIQTIARERSIVDAPGTPALIIGDGEVRFDNVHFNYGKQLHGISQGVMNGLSLTIRPGEKNGVVGRSGAGKSTLVSLLLRFYDLQGGRILIDGQDITGVTQDSLRAGIGMVTQDTSLLHRSIMDNIRYSKPDAPMQDVIAAAKQAHAHDFIQDQEDQAGRQGYQAHVGERGVKLSGGQRQRIAISRVLLKNAPILILDEATSALDSEVEMAIQENLFNLMEGKTVIAIAHRLSTIAAMDRLIIMDQGDIVEEGTHDTLLQQGGLYAELWSRQSGGFLH